MPRSASDFRADDGLSQPTGFRGARRSGPRLCALPLLWRRFRRPRAYSKRYTSASGVCTC